MQPLKKKAQQEVKVKGEKQYKNKQKRIKKRGREKWERNDFLLAKSLLTIFALCKKKKKP